MPKQGSRLFRDLNRSFGVVGEPDARALPLADTVQPVVDAEYYDPPPAFGATIAEPATVGFFSTAELVAPDDRGILVRDVLLRGGPPPTQQVFFAVRRPTALTATTATVNPVSFQGIPAQAVLNRGTGPALGGTGPTFFLQISGFPVANQTPYWYVGPGLRLVLQREIINLALDVTLFWYEMANAGQP